MGEEAYFREEMWQTRTCSMLGRGRSMRCVGPAPVSESPRVTGVTATSLCCCKKTLTKGEHAARSQRGCLCRVLVAVRVDSRSDTEDRDKEPEKRKPRGCTLIQGWWGLTDAPGVGRVHGEEPTALPPLVPCALLRAQMTIGHPSAWPTVHI